MSQIHGVAGRIHRANSRAAITACAIVALAVTAACGGQGPAPQVTPHVSASKGSGTLQDEPAGQILLKAEAATAALRSVRVSGRLSGATLDEFMSSPCQSTGTISYQAAVVHEIRLGNIVRPGDRDFLQVVLTPGARAIAIPVATGGASTGLLFPGDRVDVILTQNFKGEGAAITRRSVSETVVENLRVLAIDTLDAKAPSGSFGRTVTLEVTPQQAEKINVATELGKLSLTLRSVTGPDGVLATSTAGPGPSTGVKPTWAGDVSPALGGAMPEKTITVQQPPVEVVRGSKREAVKAE